MTRDQFKAFFDKLLGFAAFVAKFWPGDADDKVVTALKELEEEIFALLKAKGAVQ